VPLPFNRRRDSFERSQHSNTCNNCSSIGRSHRSRACRWRNQCCNRDLANLSVPPLAADKGEAPELMMLIGARQRPAQTQQPDACRCRECRSRGWATNFLGDHADRANIGCTFGTHSVISRSHRRAKISFATLYSLGLGKTARTENLFIQPGSPGESKCQSYQEYYFAFADCQRPPF
jgi:hypothetical protein